MVQRSWLRPQMVDKRNGGHERGIPDVPRLDSRYARAQRPHGRRETRAGAGSAHLLPTSGPTLVMYGLIGLGVLLGVAGGGAYMLNSRAGGAAAPALSNSADADAPQLNAARGGAALGFIVALARDLDAPCRFDDRERTHDRSGGLRSVSCCRLGVATRGILTPTTLTARHLLPSSALPPSLHPRRQSRRRRPPLPTPMTMDFRPRTRPFAALIVACPSWARSSPQEPSPNRPTTARRRALIAEDADKKVQAGDYVGAVDSFTKAFALVPAPTIKVARAHAPTWKLSRLIEAQQDLFGRCPQRAPVRRAPRRGERRERRRSRKLTPLPRAFRRPIFR